MATCNKSMVRGAIPLGTKRWIISKFGEDTYQRCLAELDPKDRILMQTLLGSTEAPASLYTGFYAALRKHCQEPGKENVWHFAAADVAMHDLGTTMKLFMRLGSPGFVAARLPAAWHHYFGSGTVDCQVESDHCLLTLDEDTQVYGEAGCEGTFGWTRAAIAYTGARNVRSEHTSCVFNGDGKTCQIKITWDPR